MAKRNINYIKPDDPPFLKVLKQQAGYDDKNHKFDELQNAEGDFVEDDDSELPQVVVLKQGDLTAEEAEIEKKRLEKEELETKADLSQRVIFKSKVKPDSESKKRKVDSKASDKTKKPKPILSFNDDDDGYDDEED
ncbi:hypothetical protein JYU34_008832 [Plutella xylostella]|uniref:Uncharacterized protein n=2 Tax=Plutella xylostella TaxID=51655 RepID=A0ABQ7QMT1_PLUXY|nr:hypothetical protein JYU34_008832 [Plutella xylostella]CAG9135248.1 unnamed protein product [Plutella xylostella]